MGSRVRFEGARRGRRRGGDGELAEVGERRAPGQLSLLSVVPSQAGSTLARSTTPRRDPRFVALPMLIAVSLVISRLIHTMPGRAARYQRGRYMRNCFLHMAPCDAPLRSSPQTSSVLQTEPLSFQVARVDSLTSRDFRWSKPTPALCTTMM